MTKGGPPRRVRSEGSGPQSWPRAPRDATVPDASRTHTEKVAAEIYALPVNGQAGTA